MGRKWYSRRTILAGLAGAVAGCGGQSTDSTTTPTGASPGARTTTTSTRTRATTSTGTSTDTTATPTETETSTAVSTTTEQPVEVREWPDDYYQGPVVSAHEHMSGPDGYKVAEGDLPEFVEWMDRNRVDQVMAIAGDYLMDAVTDHDDRLVPFAFGYNTLRNRFDELADAYRERLEQFPAYDGIGEIGLKGQLTPDGEPPIPADHPRMMDLYELAAEEDVPVMLHTVSPWRYPGGEDSDWKDPSDYPPFQQLDRAMAENRDTDFLVHESYEWNGVSDDELVARKLEAHPNLYYDISATAPKLLYGQGAFTRREFEAEVDVDAEIERLYAKYEAVLRNHSGKVLWGMDAAMEWHYEDWALDTFLDIARGILGRLPEENARNVAYRTAEDLFDIDVPESEY